MSRMGATLHAHETTETAARQGTRRAGCDCDPAGAHVQATRWWCHIESRIAVEQMPLSGRGNKWTWHRHRMLLHLQGADDDGLTVIVAAQIG